VSNQILALEQNVVGAILLDGSQLDMVDLSPNDFLHSNLRRIFEAARQLRALNAPIDALTVAEHLAKDSNNQIWLAETALLARDTISPRHARRYAELVKQQSRLRQAMYIAADLQSAVTGDTAEAIDAAIRALMEINQTSRNWSCRLSEALGAAIDDIDACHQANGKPIGLPTGIRDLDRDLGGMHRSDLIVVGARPAMGKTAFALNLALGCAAPTGIISAEQARMQIALRMIAIRGQVSLHGMRLGKIGDEEWARISTAISMLQTAPVWLLDQPAPTLGDIQRQARRWRYENRIEVLMVDYLQKIAGTGRDKRLEVGDVACGLKNLARELDIPVVALSQVKREVETRTMGEDGMGRMPYMSDLSEAGIIEQESDQVLTLYRPEVYSDEIRHKGICKVNVCKNRHGPTGVIDVAWRGEYLQFGDLAHTEQPARWQPSDPWSAPQPQKNAIQHLEAQDRRGEP
jgi:replicative DNA helicase